MLGALTALGGFEHAGLVFLDGHEDSWPPNVSPTGEAADSELGLALGLSTAPAGLADVMPCLAPQHLLVAGPRDASELAQASVVRLSEQLADAGADQPVVLDAQWLLTADLAVELPGLVDRTAGSATGGWWLHVDLDVLSTEALAAVDYQQPGGMSWSRLSEFTRIALERPGCRGASVVIYNPDLDGGAAAAGIDDYVAGVAEDLRFACG